MTIRTDNESCEKRPAPDRERGVISVHGHRLSSLFRHSRPTENDCDFLNIFVPKILKSRGIAARPAQGFLTARKKGAGAPAFRPRSRAFSAFGESISRTEMGGLR